MASVPKLKAGKPLQIQFKKPHQKCTINSLTSTLKKLIPNIKEIKITAKKLPKNINNNKLYVEQVLRSSNMKEQKQKSPAKQKAKEIPADKEIEYYPDKLKRKVDSKKIVLEPRHDYKVVATTNKRKRRTPKKDAGSLKKQKTDNQTPENSSHDLSFEDMIPSSIIHKIKDYKNTFYKDRPGTQDPKNDIITDTDTKNDPTTDANLTNKSTTDSDLKHGSKDLPGHKTKSNLAIKVNQRLRHNLKTPKDLQSGPGGAVEEMEELMNEVSLSDEDFMEILTCPSPVWWEDPPDANYVEESIGRFQNQDNLPQTQDYTKVLSKTTHPSEKTQNSNPEPNIATKTFGNKKLVEQRLKLENLLISLKKNTIKTDNTKKTNDRKRKISSDGSESRMSVDGEDLVKSLQSIEIPIKNKNIDKANEIKPKLNVDSDINEVKDVTNQSIAETDVNKTNDNKKQIKNDKKVNNNDETITKNDPKADTKTSIASVASNSPSKDKKAISPRKSTRISPKKQQLTKYYNLKSKRPRIIKQNQNKIIIETIKTNYTQKTPEKKYNRKPNDVSKIKKAYLDLLKNNTIENNLTPKPEISEKEINKESKIKDNKIESPETINNNQVNTNIENKNTKTNEIPLLLPKLTKNPKNLTVESPKSIKSVTSESTDINSEMDTISDTNIQYIDEYDSKKDELVTVYQIISKNDACTK